MNLPLLVNYLKIPFKSKSPFRAEVVFVNLKDYVDMPWVASKPIPYRDEEFGMVRLDTEGKFAFQVGMPQLFVNQIVGTQGLYGTRDILRYLQSILISRLTDLIGEFKVSVLDLAAMYDELGSGLRAKASEDFQTMGLLLKAVYITAVNVPPEVEKAIDERASMGAIGDMNAYMKFKSARALGDAAKTGGESMVGAGVGMGAGVGLGAAMAGAITEAVRPQQAASDATSASSVASTQESLEGGFEALKQTVAQQLTLSTQDKQKATEALDNVWAQLASPTSTLADFKAARDAVINQFPWLEAPLKQLLNTPAASQVIGQIAMR
jgi:membrane protease subunit (stomatin/prohibitin family)